LRPKLGKEVVVCHKCGFKAKKGGEDGRKEEVASKNVGSEASLKVMDYQHRVPRMQERHRVLVDAPDKVC
jgi:hypothetical protein